MRTAALCGLIASCAYLALHLPRLLSNIDFVYMCAGAAMLFDGKLPASPYFPPGYPALVWLLMLAGFSAMTAGALWSGLGMGLIAGAVTYVARLWQMPSAPALLMGLLTASLPSMFIVGLNPHLDSLYAGLGAVLLAAALRAMLRPPTTVVYLVAQFAGVVLISLRYHAVLLVIPVALILVLTRAKGARALGLTTLLVGLASLAATLYALQSVTGSLRNAGMDQVRTGAAYREYQTEEAISRAIFDDYAGWQKTYRAADARMVLAGVSANWPQYLTRKAILGGVLVWLVGWIVRRREPPGAIWLFMFILGYTLAISPAYFITRASPLSEIAGMLLAVAGLCTMFFLPQPKTGRKRKLKLRIDPAVAGAVISMLALAGLGYNGWRECQILPQQQLRAQLVREVNRRALEIVGGNRRQLYGCMHSCGIYGSGRFNFPGTTWSRLWMDDPAVAPLVDPYLPKHAPVDVLAGKTNVTAVLIWKSDGALHSKRTEMTLEVSPIWEEVALNGLGAKHARLWRRRLSEVKTGSD